MSMISTVGSRRVLPGDWRRRTGTKTDAHLYLTFEAQSPRSDMRPMCGKVIPRWRTERVDQGAPCSDCLVAAITRSPDAVRSARRRMQEAAID